jgi:hypothetical protein
MFGVCTVNGYDVNQPSDSYDAIAALWARVPEQAMKEAVPLIAPKVFDWLWTKIGASDYFDLLPAWYRDEVRAKNWSRSAVIANAGFPGCYKPGTTLPDFVHYHSHWLDQHLRGSLEGNGRLFNHDMEQARVELELTTLVIGWLTDSRGRSAAVRSSHGDSVGSSIVASC